MAWNNKKENDSKSYIVENKGNKEKYKEECHKLDEQLLAEFKANNKKPLLMLLDTGGDIYYLIKSDSIIVTTDNYKNPLYKDSVNDYSVLKPVPFNINHRWYNRTKKQLKNAWNSQNNIILDIADGITTVFLKYEDIEELHIIDIDIYEDIEELQKLLSDNSDTVKSILGTYPELKDDMEKWYKE